MNYGYMMGAAGLIAAMHRQDVAANNLANIQTVGFKPDLSFTIPRQTARQEEGLYDLPSNALLERLGGGILLAPNKTSFSQGTITHTRNPFDLAIQGNGFFMVSAGDSSRGEAQLTRDGRLTLDAQGRLVTAADGKRVLDSSGQPITLNPALDFNVEGDGTIVQGGQTTAKLGFVDVPNRDMLVKAGNNTFVAPPGAASSRTSAFESGGRVLQESIEESSADPIRSLNAVQSAADAAGTIAKIMQAQDDMMNRAINTLGRVTA